MQEVIVVNRNPFPVSDGYVGMKFVFEPGQKVTIPLPAAVHIFGRGIKDPSTLAAIYRRFGKTVEEGEKFISSFDFTDVNLVQQEVVDEADALKVTIEDLNSQLEQANTVIETQAEDLKKATDIMKSQEDQLAELNKQIADLTSVH